MTARTDPRGRLLPWACQTAVLASWLALFLESSGAGRLAFLRGTPLSSRELALCAVTVLAALSCATRALIRAEQRTAWALLSAGLAGYAGGFLIIFYVRVGAGAGPFGLNVSDCSSLMLYPLGFAGLAALTQAKQRRGELSATLDGAVAALAVGGVTVAVLAGGHPRLFHGGGLKIVYALAYPVGSLTLLAGALTGLALLRWRFDGRWLLLVAGFGVLAIGDCLYAVRAAEGAFGFGTSLDTVYAAGPALVGLAAWRAPRATRAVPGRSAIVLTISGVATLAALTVLMTDHSRRLPTLAVWLAGAGIFLSVARTALYLRQDRLFQRAQKDALTDELTGLPNRRAMYRLLNDRLAGEQPTTLLLIDLDGFKEVNDTLGHAAGDELLVGTSSRLLAVAGAEHVARIGGDEFAVVVAGDASDGALFAELVRAALEQPLMIDGATVAVGASVGFATEISGGCGAARATGASAAAATAAGELLRRADVAMYRAKELGSHIEAWVPALDTGTRERLELAAALRSALSRREQVVVHYQPKYDVVTRQMTGMEALARWQHPTRGLLGPPEFLPAAERAGLLADLTEHVLDAALAQVRRFVDCGKSVPVSVNITAPDLLDLDFVRRVARALDVHDVPAELLCLEVTETVVMSDPERIVNALHGLRELGVSLSLDDYGTGLSSLSYLQTLPVNELKIDRSFVSRLAQDPGSALIVGSTIGLAHGLALRVVAEGVEDEATMTVLASVGCDLVQGFLLGRPVPANELDLASVPGTEHDRPIPRPRNRARSGQVALTGAMMSDGEFGGGADGGDRCS